MLKRECVFCLIYKTNFDNLSLSIKTYKATMVSSRCVKRVDNFGRLILKHRVFFSTLVLSLYLLSIYYISANDFPSISTAKTVIINTRFLTIEDVFKVLLKSNGFLAATRTNQGKTLSSSVCVVDPVMTDCRYIGFAAFLLRTLDDIVLCRALGSERPVVFWRGCYFACSRDQRVNSWTWYFEPVNRGLETQVERVLCLFSWVPL